MPPKSDFVKNSLILSAGLIVGAALAGVLVNVLAGDEDQPPIIVSNGSVKIDAMYAANDTDRGEFMSTNGGDTAYRHDHGGGKASKFAVFLDGWTPVVAGSDCSARVGGFATQIEVTYQWVVALERKFTIGIDQGSGRLQFNFNDAKPTKRNPHRLELEGLTGALKTVVITKMGGGTSTCKAADSDASIEIRPKG
jgi:hypothetical protein